MPLTSMSRVIGFDGFDVVPCFCKNRCRTSSEKQRMLLLRTALFSRSELSVQSSERENSARAEIFPHFTLLVCALRDRLLSFSFLLFLSSESPKP